MQTPEDFNPLGADLEAAIKQAEQLIEGISNMPAEELVDYLEHTLTYGEATYEGLCTTEGMSEASTIFLIVLERHRAALAGTIRWLEKHGGEEATASAPSNHGDTDL